MKLQEIILHKSLKVGDWKSLTCVKLQSNFAQKIEFNLPILQLILHDRLKFLVN